MFGVGLPEMMVILVVAILVFGPDKLPDFARQAGRFVRQVRQFTNQARDEIRSELGPEFADLELSDFDPRNALRKHIFEAVEDDPDDASDRGHPMRAGHRPLKVGERPPYDSDAT